MSVLDLPSYVEQVLTKDPRNKKVHKSVPIGWQAVCDIVKWRPDFYQEGTNLTARKVQDRYEKIEKTFSSLYLNPGTNASDKQVLTPLQVILKRTAISKD